MKIRNVDDVEALTDEQAKEVILAAADKLTSMLGSSLAYALDDTGDYLAAAIDNYHRLFHAYWDNDGDPTALVAEVKAFLFEPHTEWGGSDGEIRFDIFEEV